MKQQRLPLSRLGLLFLAGILLTFLPTLDARADRLILKGGVEREGKIISEDEDSVTFQTSIMTMEFPKDRIEQIIRETPTPTVTPSPTFPPSGIEVYVSPTPTWTPAASPTPAAAGGEPEPEDPDRERFGRISAIKGEVTLRRPGGDWEEPRIGTVVYFDDEVRSANGRVRIVEEDKWDVRTMEGTDIQPVHDDLSPAVNLRQGKLWSQIEKISEEDEIQYRVRTPNAVAGVRGTLFAVEHEPEGGQSRIAVFEGEVAAANQEVNQAVRPNQAAIFRTEEYVGLVPAPPREKDEWDTWDDWQAEVEAIGNMFLNPGGQVIKELGAQIAWEGKMAEQALDERREAVFRQQVGTALDNLKQGILRYQRDMGELPPMDEFWQSLKYNIQGPGWQGPYIPVEQNLPLLDRWGSEIVHETAETAGGRKILRLVSPGPNRRFDRGRADDIVTIVTALPEEPAPGEAAPQGMAPGQPGQPQGNPAPDQGQPGQAAPQYDPQGGYYYYPDEGY